MVMKNSFTVEALLPVNISSFRKLRFRLSEFRENYQNIADLIQLFQP